MSSFAVPGIRFVVDPPRPDADLPRMDIAGFVGLAASGPVGVPVVVEDEVAFTEIFGGDLPLAWDMTTEKVVSAQLAGSVRAFFRGGGTRCWVVRVTGSTATTQRFPLLGMLARRANQSWRGADIAARSVGSWADGVQVETRLRSLAVRVYGSNADARAGPLGDEVDNLSGYGDWRKGDLLRRNHASGRLEYRRVTAVAVHPQSPEHRVLAHEFVLGVEPIATDQRPDGRIGLRINNATGGHAQRKGDWLDNLTIDLSGLPLPQAGELLCGSAGFDGKVRAVALQVGEVSSENGLAEATVLIEAAWFLDVGEIDARQDALVHVERLRLDLRTHLDGVGAHLVALGFDASHPRSWTRLPDDRALFPLPDATMPPQRDNDTAALYAEVDHPRFPLAAIDEAPIDCVPLGMIAVPDPRWRATASAPTDPLSVFARDGLDSYSAAALVDPELVKHGVDALPGEAFHRRYQMDVPLAGLHALYFIGEMSLLALPDATHAAWSKQPLGEVARRVAVAVLDEPLYAHGALTVTWQADQGKATHWRLQVAAHPDFNGGVTEIVVDRTKALPKVDPRCSGRLWFRVRAEIDGGVGVWSNTVSVLPAAAPFARINDWLPVAPRLSIESAQETRCRLAWTHPGAGDDGVAFELQESEQPDFADSELIYAGADSDFELIRPLTGIRHYRVRAVYTGGVGPWSATGMREPEQRHGWVMNSGRVDTAGLADVHVAMITFAAARADVFTVLSMPQASEYPDVERYRAGLAARFETAWPAALSHVALYHPWSVLAGRDGVRALPPDGPVLGEFARRAVLDGAWIAPANHAFDEGLGLAAPGHAPDAQWAALYGNGVNLLRHRPEGITVMSAETLAVDDALRSINVRRLLILLRRLALREGDALVFEPNDASFRRRVQSRFETLLGDLFERGAFSGARKEQGFQVVVDESVNTAQSVDAGRFIVELRVAPSRPLAFLTVRLVQSGADGLAVESV